MNGHSIRERDDPQVAAAQFSYGRPESVPIPVLAL